MVRGTLHAVKRVWVSAAVILVVAIIATSIMMGLFSGISSDNSAANGSASASKNTSKIAKKPTKPRWVDLTPAQREALAPLATEWDQINAPRKKKWLEIGNKVALMAPEEKQRVQDRIRDWVKLTPEQRHVARSNFAQTKKLDPNEKFAQWQRYQQLTEEQKKELAASGAPVKKQVANRPAKSEKNTKIARSVKSTPKLELEKSVLPPASQPVAPSTPAPVAPAVPAALTAEAAPA
jgi:hypothetical protein